MMRIEGFNPMLPSGKIKDERKSSPSTSPSTSDQFLHSVENAATYGVPAINKDQQLQVKNYVTTVLYRQNWVEKSSRFSTQFSRSSVGMEPQDTTYWKPEQVAKRIVSFAKSFGDNTTIKIDQFKETALRSLDDTTKLLGGTNSTLQRTQEQIGQEFEAWKNEISST